MQRLCVQSHRAFCTSIRHRNAAIPRTLKELIAVNQIDDCNFVSAFNPQKHGSTQAISYGGIPLAHTISAASGTVDPKFKLYSCSGAYLGPTSILKPVEYSVQNLRSTRSFNTRVVEAWQTLDDGQRRRTMFVLLDFHTPEDGMFDYSVPPMRQDYPGPDELLPIQEALQQRVIEGDLTPELVNQYNTTFPLHNRYFESKGCPSGVGWQNLSGMDSRRATTQDDLPITSKTNAMWFKSKTALASHAESAAALAFLSDGALAFMPLTHTKRSIRDAGPVSSLEFSFRVLSSKLDVNDWFLQEQHTEAAGDGRTFSVGKVYAESGKLLAEMSQTCILRKKKEA